MKTLTFIISVCFAALLAQAATVSFSTNNYRVLLNHKLDIPVFVQADENIYSISADLVYESQYLAVQDSDGNITNGIQPVLDFSSIFPNPKKYCSALEDGVQGRVVWGISQNLPATSGTSFSTNSRLFTASFNTDEIGTNSLMFGFKKTTDSTGGVINTTWEFANVYIITDKLPPPEVNDLPAYSPGSSLSLNWPSVDDAEFYQAYCAYDPYFTNMYRESAVFTATNYTFTSLIETTQFYYLVLATNVIGQRGFSVTNSSIQDFNPPTNISMTVNNNDYYIDSNIIPVKFSGEDLSPMTVKADIDDGSISSWDSFSTWATYYYTSTWVNGEKEITGIFKDSAGQISSLTTNFFLDSIAPSNALIIINNGAGTTALVTVNLALSADDISPLEMIVANKADFSDGSWQSNETSKTWNLPNNGAGIYTVYARFRDPVGHLSSIISDDIYYSAVSTPFTNIFLVAPANNASVVEGTVNFSWNAQADVYSPQYISISPGGVYAATDSYSVPLSPGNYTWFVYATNAYDIISKSETRALTVFISPSIDPIVPQTVREHQILFVTLKVNNANDVSYDNSEIVGVHYLDTNRYIFSLIPDFDTAGQNWNVPFIAKNTSISVTQNMNVTVTEGVKKISTKKPLRFEDADEDIIDIKYNGIKKNDSVVIFDGQRLIISNTYDKGKLVFKVKYNKKAPAADGSFDLQEIHIDNDTKGLSIAASVANIFAGQFYVNSIKINGAGVTLSNLYINSASVISVSKGVIIGSIVVSNSFKKLTAADIINSKIFVNNGDNISISAKNDIDKSTIVVNGTGNALAVKKISTGGKGEIKNSKIIVGLPDGTDYTTVPAQAGFKLIKTKTMTNVDIAGSEYVKGKKLGESKIKVKSPSNSVFYRTESGVVTPEVVD
ncbi:hypothetical protein KAH27_04915 [bacterium]|nr:hypothetical protein [bacterium]